MLTIRKKLVVLVFLIPFAITGCASTTSSEYARAVNDPMEPMNRVTFSFNRIIDTVIIKPAAMAYRTVMPEIMQDCIHNFLQNLHTPVVLINNLLQGEFEQAGMTLGRLMTNTVFGLGGTVDVATMLEVPKSDANFGLTMAKWGVDEGPYFVVPVIGPSTIRGAVGMGVDFFLNPINLIALNPHNEKLANLDWIRYGFEVVDTRARMLPITDDLERNSIDLYAATRSMYRQNMRYAVQGKKKAQKLDYDYDFNVLDE